MTKLHHRSLTSLLSSMLILWGVLATSLDAKPQPGNLFEAVEQADHEAIKRLIENGADPNAKNERGNTALHEAILHNEAKVVNALMGSGADATVRNGKGLSSGFLCSVMKKDMALTALVMKTEDDSADVAPYPLASFGSSPQRPREFASPATLTQWNPRFAYRFVASPFWKLQGIQQDGMFENQSIVVVSLPPLWSDIEKQSIENAISVYAKERDAIETLGMAVEEFLARNPSAKSSDPIKVEDVDPHRIKFTYKQSDSGLTYKKQSVIAFHNGISYQIDFTATSGTFDKNLPVFTAFCDAIDFIEKTMPDDTTTKGDGADQPATAPESKPEGNAKPKLEAEGRSQ